jgi:hypothetical protein
MGAHPGIVTRCNSAQAVRHVNLSTRETPRNIVAARLLVLSSSAAVDLYFCG